MSDLVDAGKETILVTAPCKAHSFAFEPMRQAFFKTPLLLTRVILNSRGSS